MTAAFLAAWWTQGVIIAAVLAATAVVLQWIARDAVPARAIWGAALLGTTLLTFASPLRLRGDATRGVTVVQGMPLDASEVDAAASVDAAELVGRAAAAVRRLLDAAPSRAAEWARALPDLAGRVLLVAWLLASTLILALVFGSHRRLRRALRAAPAHEIVGVPVRVTSGLGPAVIGARDSLIVVPRWLLELPLPEQALVVRHERSHVVARDPLLLMTGVALAALQPWNPFAWLLVSRLRLAIELDCDRRLLAGGTSPRDYGDLLIALAGAASPAARPPLLHPMFSLHTSHLAQRILAMTERPVRLILARRLAVASLAAVALVAACESKLPTDAEIRDMDAETAVRGVAGVAALDPAQVRYIVDGSLVETEVAKAIPAERISAVSVQNGKSEVYITTLDRAPGQPPERESIVERRVQGRPLDASIVTRDSASGASIVRRDGARAEEFTGLVILDGVRSDIRKLRELPPDRIESVSVVKGAAALAQYGEAGANGVIVIKTKPRR